ncbi:MAG: hypothetical protein COA33_014810 [Fluviicola sp.]|nr:hypothetical protein [Fluviicola sp.]
MSKLKIENLWNWFVNNEDEIIDIIDNELAADYIVESLDNRILDFGLFSWEIAPGKLKPWSLTISPNGDADLLKISREIMNNAPRLSNWEFHYCKQAKDWNRTFEIYDELMNEHSVIASNWKFVALPKKGNQVQLIIEADNILHLDDETRLSAGELFVLNEIGEKARIQKVDSVHVFTELEEMYEGLKISIDELKKHF